MASSKLLLLLLLLQLSVFVEPTYFSSVNPGQVRSKKENLLGQLFYKPDIVHVTEPTASKH